MASTSPRGDATFRLDATGNQTYEARFGATAPGDITAYLPSASQPLNFVLGPTDRVKLSSPLRAGPQSGWRSGSEGSRQVASVTPFVAGAQVTVRVTRNGKKVKRKSAAVTKSGNDGRFKLSFAVSKRGTYRVSAVQAATGGLGSGRSSAKRLFIVGPHAWAGSSGTAVRALQSRLKKLAYVTSVNGTYDGSTSRAVLAFRKVFGMRRVTVANKAVFKRLARGGGGFRVRYPKAGKHAEFDWSRQVLVLARGAQPVKILPRVVRQAVHADRVRQLPLLQQDAGLQREGDVLLELLHRRLRDPWLCQVPAYPASHGCIRIPIPSAIAVYRWIPRQRDLRLQVAHAG